VLRVFRVLRGALGLSIVWGAAWGLVAAASFARDLIGGSGSARESFVIIRAWATYGAISGFIFAVLLVAARRRALGSLTLPRVAVWGATSGIIIPIGFALGALARDPGFFSEWNPVPALLAFAGLGCACAVGSIFLARRADRDSSSGESDSMTGQLAEPQPELSRVPQLRVTKVDAP
jgi:hypothetical protein